MRSSGNTFSPMLPVLVNLLAGNNKTYFFSNNLFFSFIVSVGEIRILLSRSWWSKISNTLGMAPLTLGNFTDVLSLHITILNCGVYAYMSSEEDLVVLIAPSQKDPTLIQVSIQLSHC